MFFDIDKISVDQMSSSEEERGKRGKHLDIFSVLYNLSKLFMIAIAKF